MKKIELFIKENKMCTCYQSRETELSTAIVKIHTTDK